jgi:2-polyprenyl-3-methyl-5-hydroxy-6-metoxy-1,4-benzoquinol methylase
VSVCPICAARDARQHVSVSGYSIVECPVCHFRWVDPVPTAAELVSLYTNPQYFSSAAVGYADYLGAEASHRRLARRRLDRIERLTSVGSILDVGCAAGFFLEEASRRGWRSVGVEIAPGMRQEAERRSGGRVFSSAEDAARASGPFDVITMWEYIEHVPAPAEDLQTASSMLSEQGILAISTPNTGHYLATEAPKRWPEYRPPAHLSFFTAATLIRLLERADLRPCKTVYTTPLTSFDGPVMLAMDSIGRWLGTGSRRKTPFWWIYSLLHRIQAAPAHIRSLSRPERFCTGVEVYARRR